MKMRATLAPIFLLCATAAIAAAETSSDAIVTLSAGSDLSVYDNPRSQQGSVPLDITYYRGSWTFEATDTDFYREGTPATTFKGKNGKTQIILVPEHVGSRVIWVPRPRKPIPGEPTQYGWGDLTLNTTYSAIAASDNGIGIDFTISATLPTGDKNKGFSTGTEEYSAGTVITKIAGPMTYAINALHSWNGAISGGQIQDNWSGQISTVYGALSGNTIGFQMNWSQPSVPNTGSSRILSLISSIVLTKRDKLSFTLGHGFSLNDPTTDINFTYSRTY